MNRRLRSQRCNCSNVNVNGTFMAFVLGKFSRTRGHSSVQCVSSNTPNEMTFFFQNEIKCALLGDTSAVYFDLYLFARLNWLQKFAFCREEDSQSSFAKSQPKISQLDGKLIPFFYKGANMSSKSDQIGVPKDIYVPLL